MKKNIASAVIIVLFLSYCFLHAQANSVADVPTTRATSRSSATSAPPTPMPTGTADTTGGTPSPTATPAPTKQANSPYKDGAYTGLAADAQWGLIQVKAIIQNGKITDVQFLQYPNERNRSRQINNYADPQLTSEAIQAQSAQVDIVSGATDTSEAFIQSLSDALSQAKA